MNKSGIVSGKFLLRFYQASSDLRYTRLPHPLTRNAGLLVQPPPGGVGVPHHQQVIAESAMRAWGLLMGGNPPDKVVNDQDDDST